jgi:hypothetical protein
MMPMSRATGLLRADQVARRIELDEVVRLAAPETLALIRGLIVHRLTRLVRHVRNPVLQSRELLGDARAAREVRPARPLLPVSLHRFADRAVADILAGAAGPAAGQQGHGDNGK